MSAVTSLESTGAFTAEAFASRLQALAAAPSWWRERRQQEFERFASVPLPVRTDEKWRFSNLKGVSLDGFAPAEEAALPPRAESSFGPADLTFVNGRAVTTGEAGSVLPQGVTVSTLAAAVARQPELLRSHFMGQPQRLGSEKFAALHAAFLADGAFIHVPRGVEVTRPIVIAHHAVGAGIAVFPHTLVVAEENARITVVESFHSPSGTERQFACGANDLYAGHGANITYLAAQAWSPETLSLQLNSTVVGRDSRVQMLNLHLGGRQARHESMSQLRAPGAFSEMLALTVANDSQEFDQRTLQVHQAPDTRSDLLYKNALRGHSRTIFSGLIVVDPDAQRTDAYQSNRNLMLSEDAEANSLPGLEIQANDVRCTHGATSSRIDREQEFYLESRGIPQGVADELITFGFFEEVLNRLENQDLHEALQALIRTKFEK